MIGFLLALVAGFLTPQAETAVARPLAKAVAERIRVEPGELRALGFMVAMLIAALLCEILDTGSPFGVVAGGVIGFFGLRLVAVVKSAIDGR